MQKVTLWAKRLTALSLLICQSTHSGTLSTHLPRFRPTHASSNSQTHRPSHVHICLHLPIHPVMYPSLHPSTSPHQLSWDIHRRGTLRCLLCRTIAGRSRPHRSPLGFWPGSYSIPWSRWVPQSESLLVGGACQCYGNHLRVGGRIISVMETGVDCKKVDSIWHG